MQSTNQLPILRFIKKLGLTRVGQSLKEMLDPATPPGKHLANEFVFSAK